MRKTVYLVTGSPEEVAQELRRVRPTDPVRVVAKRSAIRDLEVLGGLERRQILSYTPLTAAFLWLRLWIFLLPALGSEVVCLRSPGRFRFLKLLAWSLPGKLVFTGDQGHRLSCSRFRFLRAALASKGPICVAASASPEHLKRIEADVRQRYPEARVQRIGRPSLVGRNRARAVVLPCTGEKFAALKIRAWLLPVVRVEVYNENLDVFSGRNPFALARHWVWRMRQTRNFRRGLLPVGVIGSASGLFLKTIVEDVRSRQPGASVHGLLPEHVAEQARGLFDTVTILKPGLGGCLRQFWQAALGQYQYWIIPCTDEPYPRMKALAFLAPFARRRIYNELADSFAVRDAGTLRKHILWRLRDHLSFQVFAGTAGRRLPVRLVQLAWYSLRLLAGAELLARVRIRAALRAWFAGGRAKRPAVDMIYLESAEAQAAPSLPPGRVRLAARVANDGRRRDLVEQINAAVKSSRAEFVCLFDSRCSMPDVHWLARLLETFDDRTGQVGPQIVSSIDGSVIRGGLVGAGGRPKWNSDHAVCWRARPEWLAIEALPWVCVVFRRAAVIEAGLFSEGREEEPPATDPDFCRRLAAHGRPSICNESVTALFPSVAGIAETAPVIGSFPRR